MKLQKPSAVALALSTAAVATVAIFAWLVQLLSPQPNLPQQPIEASNPPLESCGQYDNNSDQLQTCCEAWAEENQILRPQCVGSWVVRNNQCAWQCTSQ